MSADSLITFYQDELLALRKDAYLFGKRYPDLAPLLGLKWGDVPDPMVERLIEALAWFAARIREDSQARMPLAAQQILRRIHPHFIYPLPSIGIVSMTPMRNMSGSRTIPAGSRLHCTGAEDEIIRWRTGWPLTLSNAVVEADDFLVGREGDGTGAPSGACCFRLKMRGLPEAASLRLFLKGDAFSTHPLHQWVHSNLLGVRLVVAGGDGAARTIDIGKDALRPGGLAPEELVLPAENYAHPSYQLVQEYFACPDRFLFWDLLFPGDVRKADITAVILILRLPPPATVSAKYVRFDPFAVPVVNLFETVAEPLHVDHTRHCLPLEADRSHPDSTEIHSILEVEALFPGLTTQKIPYQGLSFTGAELSAPSLAWRWYERRKQSLSGNGSEVELFFKCLDPDGMNQPFTASARVLCTNRDKAAALGVNTILENDDEMQIEKAVMERSPTRHWDPPLDGDDLWRLISSLTLHQAFLSGDNGPEALKEILRTFAPRDSFGVLSQIDGITDLECTEAVAPLRPTRLRPMGGAASGHAFDLRLNAASFQNGSPFLFASVLEAFLANFAGINSFTQLTAHVNGEQLYAWPPRSGRQRL